MDRVTKQKTIAALEAELRKLTSRYVIISDDELRRVLELHALIDAAKAAAAQHKAPTAE